MLQLRLLFTLRYILLVNAVAALIPALAVRGREHDPLLNVRWWPHEYHSAVIVVLIAAALGTGLVYVLITRNIVRWWAYCACGGLVGAIPGLFYMTAMPSADMGSTPAAWTALFGAMVIIGFFWGAVMGLVNFAAVGRRRQMVSP